jgi:hypothetical protein
MSLEMVNDETLAIECPDIVFSKRFALNIPALIGILDRHYCTIRSVHALNHCASCRHKSTTTNWTEHLSSPLKVRKIPLTSIIVNMSALSKEFSNKIQQQKILQQGRVAALFSLQSTAVHNARITRHDYSLLQLLFSLLD